MTIPGNIPLLIPIVDFINIPAYHLVLPHLQAIFQRTMGSVLQGIPHVICYLDDILVTGCTVQSARVLAESFSPDSSLSPEEDVYCNCGGRDVGDMVECDGRSCTFQWFHFDCVGITEAPEGKWYCDDCSQELNIDDSCVEVIGESPATSTPVRPPTSAPRKRSSLQVHVFPPAKKSKLSASCSTVQSARVLAESFSPDSSLSPEEDVYCNCGGRDVGDMVECDGRSCTFQWFHFDCVGITEAPEGKWYCDDCSQELNMDDSCVEVIGESPATVTVTGPLPTEEWKSAARDVIAKLSRCELTARSQRVQKIPCRDIEPHIRDRVQGDGNCLFRAFSKEVTGTESNHRAVRQAILNFMTHKDNAYSFCNDCFAGDTLAANLYEPIESMTNYIKEKGLDQRGWGTDREIRAFATLCQIDVCTYSDNGSSRAWLKFFPLFCNEHCMPKSDYKIYLFHTEDRKHYDRVVPSV